MQLAGSLKGVVYCRGPLDTPIFEGTVETTGKNMTLTYNTRPSVAIHVIQENLNKGAVAAYDHVPFVFACASFTFNTDNCVSILFLLSQIFISVLLHIKAIQMQVQIYFILQPFILVTNFST